MKREGIVFLLVMALGLFSGCTSNQAPEKAKIEKAPAPAAIKLAPRALSLPVPAEPLPPPPEGATPEASAKRAPAAAGDGYQESLRMDTRAAAPAADGMTVGGDAAATGGQTAESLPAAKNGGAQPYLSGRWQDFLASFKSASYTFNPPSPIKVAQPHTIHLWVDTTVSHRALAEELKKMVPRDARRVESGTIQVSPVMKATLTGENFTIKPNSPEQQSINLAGRTIWSWEITPTWPGTQILHLRLIAIPPKGIADPYTIPVPLDRAIQVKVTFWWLLDSFFDKYWKWLLGGIGTLLLTVLGWWWKKRSGEKG